MNTLAAASMASTILGDLGTAGAAALVTAAIFLGTRKKARKAHKWPAAVALGGLAALLYTTANWTAPGDLVHQINASGQKLGIGLGAIAGILALWLWHGTHTPRRAAILGFWLLATAAGAGGFWTHGFGLLSSVTDSTLH
ncbi:hypothetical protein [Streptacidiphilus jiangxiensis]|uniref:Uncharacterized protein n=1 Tax=Streptacidiphilus jiangxiensis TaxID=235985 RepID=A0A1H8BL85_STRJI|nr:hypothetical protein [Streptacidiphilus jiangxiensis]SEM82904.1 hypothetical protein SAMN05414137_1684 [Streptacidiphilus jiangxiensis]